MRTNYLDSLSDYRWQEERSELLSEIAEDCWTGRSEVVCTIYDFIRD